MWINVTTVYQAGIYEVEMNTITDRYRYRHVLDNNVRSDWIPGMPPEKEEVTKSI